MKIWHLSEVLQKKKTPRSGLLPDVFRRGEKTLLFKLMPLSTSQPGHFSRKPECRITKAKTHFSLPQNLKITRINNFIGQYENFCALLLVKLMQ